MVWYALLYVLKYLFLERKPISRCTVFAVCSLICSLSAHVQTKTWPGKVIEFFKRRALKAINKLNKVILSILIP